MIDTFRHFHIAIIVIIAIQSHRVFSAAVQDSSSTWTSTSNPLPTTQVDGQSSRMIYWSHQSWRSRPDSSTPVKLCGYRLLDAVRVLCRGSFNSFSRRSDTTAPSAPRAPTNNNNIIPQSGTQNLNSVTLNENTSSSQNVNNARTSQRRVRRHIIEECCRRACNRRQMLKYCDWNV